MASLVLRDEALIQVRLSSEELDGVTLKELAQAFLALLQLLIVILEFSVRVVQFIGRVVTLPWRVFRLERFWSRLAWLL